jgi:orotate phosphoribosyltransferase-like protein
MLPVNKHESNYIHASWLEHSIQQEKLRVILPRARRILRKYQFDSIAFRGVSGALTAPILAYMLRKNLLAVRKEPNEDGWSHSTGMVEGDANARRYIIVDDFVSSGKTIRKIFERLREFAPSARCLGILEIEAINNIKFHSYGSAISSAEIIRHRGRITAITEKFVTRYLEFSAGSYLTEDAEK